MSASLEPKGGYQVIVKEEIKKMIEEALSRVPVGHASDLVIKEIIRCVLYGFL